MQKQLADIEDKKSELIKLGYREGEVNAFIHDAANGKKLLDLSMKELEDIVDYLDSYISFAQKSYKLVLE